MRRAMSPREIRGTEYAPRRGGENLRGTRGGIGRLGVKINAPFSRSAAGKRPLFGGFQCLIGNYGYKSTKLLGQQSGFHDRRAET